MATEWSDILARLDTLQGYDYFKRRSMPDDFEPLVTELVTSFGAAPDDRRNELLARVSPEACFVLGWYARKLAGRAVREGSHPDLWNALVATAIRASKEDYRDVMSVMAILYNSAIRLDEDPRAPFTAAARTSTPAVVKLFEGFLNRPDDMKSISVFGFSEGVGPEGFDYLPLLPEYGGPDPLGRW